MKLLKFADGSKIYRAGEPADRAFVVRSGRVVIAPEDADPITLSAGELFGVRQLIGAGKRAETAHADGKTVVASFHRDEVLEGLDEPDVMAAALRALIGSYEPGDAPAAPRLRLLPNGARIRKQIGPGGMEIARLPFTIGRINGSNGINRPAAPEAADLELADEKPYQLSRQHFSIQMGEDGPVVRDAGSHHGTVVNGTRLGHRYGGPTFAPLAAGRNLVEAGGAATPFRFIVTVEPQG